MATATGTVGSKAVGAGAQVDQSFGPGGGLRVNDSSGKYTDVNIRGRLFTACNQAAVTSGAGLSATVATLSLTNPVGSGVYLILIDYGFTFSTAAAAATSVYLAATAQSATAVTHTTPATVRSALWTGLTATGNVGLVDTVATLPAAPLIARTLLGSGTTGLGPSIGKDDVAGAFILAPGTAAVIQASAAAIGFCHLTWEEQPIVTPYV
jgi:hypothetical protein